MGTVLAGRYRIVRKLGEGAMGDVYLAEHIQIRRHDAIKILRPNLASDPDAIARFLRGARNISTIRHPNVCAIYDFTETEQGLRFLAMEYVDGPTLKDVLAREGRLSPDRAIAIAVQTADALQAAHDAGIVHRDLKPGNIMVRPERGGREIVKVVDFDIAKAAEGGDEVTRLGFVVGTPEYMSPEQLTGEPLDGRSDLYSLGLLLFRMLTGTLPFRAEGPQDLMVARLTSSPMKLTDALPGASFPDQIQRALDRALQRQATGRQADAAEFAREIEALSGAPTVTSADLPPTRVTPTPSSDSGAKQGARAKRPGWVYAAAGGLGAAALAVVLLLTQSGGDNHPPDSLPPTVGQTDDLDSGDPNLASADADTQPSRDRDATGGQPDPDLSDDGGEAGEPTGTDPAADNDTRPTEDSTDMPQLTTQSQFASAGAVDELLLGFSQELTDLDASPASGRLTGIRDTLLAVLDQASRDGQRRTAARLLAYLEVHSGNRARCLTWRDEVNRLGGDVAELEALCEQARP